MNILVRPFFLLLLLIPAVLQAQVAAQSGPKQDVSLDGIVAVVNDDVVLQSELTDFVADIKQQLRAHNTQLPPDSVLERQALERLVLNHIQLQLADKIGIRVGDEQLNRAVESIANSNHMSLDQFRQAVESNGVSFADFRENVRKQIIMSGLQQREVDDRIQVTEQEVESFLANQKNSGQSEKLYHLQQVLIAVPDAASPEQIQKAQAKAEQVLAKLRSGADFGEIAVAVSDGQHALEGGDIGWFGNAQLPTLYADEVYKMKVGDISGIIRSPSGFHIIKLLGVKGDDKHFVEQTLARHILIRTSALVSDEDARTRLTQLRTRILNGEDFAALARSHSEDTLSAREGGSLGWLNPGDTVPEFEQVMDRLKIGEISQPFRSRFGWHIVQVQNRREQDDTKEFERVRARKLIHERKRQEALELWLRRIRDEAYVEYRTAS